MNLFKMFQAILCWIFFNKFDFCDDEPATPLPSPMPSGIPTTDPTGIPTSLPSAVPSAMPTPFRLIQYKNPKIIGFGRFQSVCQCKQLIANRPPDSLSGNFKFSVEESVPPTTPQLLKTLPKSVTIPGTPKVADSKIFQVCLDTITICPSSPPTNAIDYQTFVGSIKANSKTMKGILKYGFNFPKFGQPDCSCLTETKGPTEPGPPVRRFLVGPMQLGSKQDHKYVELAKSLDGDLRGMFNVYSNLLSSNERMDLVQYADQMYLNSENKAVSPVEADHILDIGVSELAGMVGPESIQKIRDAVQDFGFVASHVQVRRTVVSEAVKMDLHSDGGKLSFLNIRLMHATETGAEYAADDSDFMCVNEQGLENPSWAMGDGIAHGPNLIHGYSTKPGVRYILVLFGSHIDQFESWREPEDVVDLVIEEQATW